MKFSNHKFLSYRTFVHRYYWDILVIFLISIILLASIRTIFYEGYIVYCDHPFHYYHAWVLANSKSLFPWDTNFGFGWTYIALNPLIYYLTVAFSFVTDLNLSYKLVVVLSYVLVSISIYFLLRVFNFSYITSLIIMLLIVLPYEYENSLNGIFTNVIYVGQIAWIISIAFTIFAFGFYVLYIENKRKKFLLLSIMFISLSFLSSITFYIVPIFLFFIYPLIFATGNLFERVKLSIKYIFLIFSISSLLIGFWIINIFYEIKYDFSENIVSYLFDISLLSQYTQIKNMFFWPMLFLIPIIIFLYKKNTLSFKFTIFMSISSIFFIFLSLGTSVHDFLNIIPGYDKLYFARFLLYGKIFLLLALSPLLEYFINNFKNIKILEKVIATSLLLVCLQLMVSGLQYTDIDYPLFSNKKDIGTSKDFTLTKDYMNFYDAIHEGDRVYVQDIWGSLPMEYEDFLIPLKYKFRYKYAYPYSHYMIYYYPNIAKKNGFYLGAYSVVNYVYWTDIFSDFNKIFGYDVKTIKQNWVDEILYSKSLELGITYYMVFNNNLKRYLDKSDKFIKIRSYGIFSLYVVKERPMPVSIENGSLEYLNILPDKIRIAFRNDHNASIILKLKYRNDLRVIDDNKNELRIEPLYVGEYIFMKINPYDNSKEIYIEKEHNKTFIGSIFSLLGLIILWRIDEF